MDQPQSSDSPAPSALAELASAQHRIPAASRSTHPHGNRSSVPCRFFGSKKGCRSGDACPYRHEALAASPDQADAEIAAKENESPAVSKPVTKAQKDSPRNFQIGQLRRRFHPKEDQEASGNTTFTFGMAPTDPDFPFDLAELCCSLHVPHDWPSGAARVKLRVTNAEMPKGFQFNVERGFDGLVDSAIKERRSVTLLGLMNSLDRNLERFLIAEKAPTIKLIPNARSPKPAVPKVLPEKTKNEIQQQPHKTERIVPVPPRVVYSPEDRAEAEKTRSSETRQLEARLNRLPLYKKLTDGISYIVPVTPTKPERLPVSLRAVKTAKLSVPLLYPLEKSSIELQAAYAEEARAVDAGFRKWVLNGPHTTLMAQVNYLAHNMHLLIDNAPTKPEGIHSTKIQSSETATADVADEDRIVHGVDTDRPHIKVIPRPPEWSMPNTGGQDADSDTTADHSSDLYEDLTEEDEDQDGGAPIPETTTSSTHANAPARGTALNLPGLELYGIELLEAKSLSITVKCDRCKEHTDIKNIKATDDPSQPSPVKVESCRKCANSFNITFRRELMHPTSQRAGYLDLEGCTAFDLLPSNFQPTCSECSTPFPAPGVLAVRGTSATASCRECHRKMNFKISEVKFMVVGISALSHHRLAAPRKKVRENLGITSGQELPRRGRCGHYGKSYRWFRFSCCAKVFPCDKCHDAATDHPNEHANRMICGFCSREQHYRPETCGICKNVLVGKAGSGFWEGGKGTRDKVKMSRKDPRKYKRV